jgi:hypothetical protein
MEFAGLSAPRCFCPSKPGRFHLSLEDEHLTYLTVARRFVIKKPLEDGRMATPNQNQGKK